MDNSNSFFVGGRQNGMSFDFEAIRKLAQIEELNSKLLIIANISIFELVELVINHQLRTGNFEKIKDILISEQNELVNLSDEYADLERTSSGIYEVINKIIKEYELELTEEVDSLVLENYNPNEDLAKIVGDPQEWKHKQKKRPWN